MKERVGIFGGTFDPPHRGHLQVARSACDELKLDRLLWIPAGSPPHKSGDDLSDAHHREAMTRLMVAEDARFRLERFEIARAAVSFTVETLEYLTRENPDATLILIMGEDQWTSFDSWSQPDTIRSLSQIAVYHRSGGVSGAEPASPTDNPDYWLTGSLLPEASTSIRDRIKNGETADGDLVESVADYVRQQALYR